VRRQGVTAVMLDPDAPTLCFCDSCMRLGGAARAQLLAEQKASWQKAAQRIPEDPANPEQRRTRNNEVRRERDRAARAAKAGAL